VTNKIRSTHGTIVAKLQLYASPKDALRLQEKKLKIALRHYNTLRTAIRAAPSKEKLLLYQIGTETEERSHGTASGSSFYKKITCLSRILWDSA
jgi:hypothetical protein